MKMNMKEEKSKEKKGARVYAPTKELEREMFNAPPGKKKVASKMKKAEKPKSRK